MKQIRKFSFRRVIAAFSVAALLFGSGCTRDDADNVLGKSADGPIRFQVNTTSALTKGGSANAVEHLGSTLFDVVDGNELYLSLESTPWEVDAATKVAPYKDKGDLTSVSFGMAVYKQDTETSPLGDLHGGPVEAPYGGSYWEPTTPILWPNLGKKVHFFVYAPYDAALTMTAASNTEPTLAGFQVVENYLNQKDLLFARDVTADSNPLILNGGGAMEAYKITFEHALAAIRFKIDKNANITVNSVKVRGVYDAGTLNMNTGEWTDFENKGNVVTISSPISTTTSGDGLYEIFDEKYTLMMIPNGNTAFGPSAEIEVNYTSSEGNKTITHSIASHQWRQGYMLTYVIGDYVPPTDDYDYFFSVTEQPTLTYEGKISDNSKIISYKEHKTTHAQTPIGWVVEGYYRTLAGAEQGKVSDRISNGITGSFLYKFTPEGGAGSTDGETITIAHPGATPTRTSIKEPGKIKDQTIAATPKKERQGGKAYNLSNPADPYSDVVMNTANTYIINGAGYYRFPIVMGNGVKNGVLNPDAYTQTGFVDYKGAAITDPYLRGAGSQGTPTYVMLEWSDDTDEVPYTGNKIINVVDPTAVHNNRPNAQRSGYYLDYPGASNGITKTTDANGDVYWVNFHVESATRQGVACLSLLNESGVPMWNWLIWLTDYQPGVGDIEVDYLKESFNSSAGTEKLTFMPIVLGYVDNTYVRRDSYAGEQVYVRLKQSEGTKYTVVSCIRPAVNDVLANTTRIGYAPFYQWGRIVPITPSSGNWPHDEKGSLLRGGFSRILMSETGPIAFPGITYDAAFVINPNRWSENIPLTAWNALNTMTEDRLNHTDEKVVKTIYDPCPVGYTVPRRNAFTGFGVGVATRDDGYGNLYAATNHKSFDLGWTLYTNWRSSTSEAGSTETLFMPILSRRSARNSAIESSETFTSWKAVPYSAVYFNSQGVCPAAALQSSVGHSILPQREE